LERRSDPLEFIMAVAALQKCFGLLEERMVWTKDEPRFAALKDDPCLRAILQRMNIAN
jgi:hypothetical protein